MGLIASKAQAQKEPEVDADTHLKSPKPESPRLEPPKLESPKAEVSSPPPPTEKKRAPTFTLESFPSFKINPIPIPNWLRPQRKATVSNDGDFMQML